MHLTIPTAVIVACTFVTSPASARKAAPSGPRLDLAPQKDALVLARDPGTLVRITLHGAKAASDATPRVAASVGSLGELKKAKDGQWEIAYTIPDTKPPSVAILIAEIETEAGVVSGATAVRLLGKARVSIKTEKNARVHLKVAGRREGPFEADDAGVVETSITVPPGYEEFQIIAKDKAGNRSKRKKALAVPPFPMVAIGPAPAELTADGTHTLKISVAAVSNRGDLVPFRGKCRSNEGKLKKLDVHSDIGRWQLKVSAVGSGQARVTCNTGGGKHRVATLELQLVPGALHALALTGPSECAAGQTCDLMIEAKDVAGNPIINLPILDAKADLGAVAMDGPDDSGAVSWAFTAPDTYEPERVATVTLAADAGPRAKGRITLSPAAVAELSFESVGESVLLGSEIRIPVRAVDAYGNPVPVQPPPTLTADVGEATWVAEGEGAPAIIYKSPERASTETTVLRMSYDTLRAELPLMLEGRWRHTHLTARAGVMVLRNGLWGPSLGLDVSSSLPPLDGRFAVAIRVGGTRSQSSSPIEPTGELVGTVDQVLWMIPFVAGMDGVVVDGGSWSIVAGVAGGGLVLVTSLDVQPRTPDDRNSVPPDRDSVVLSPAASAHLRFTLDLGPGELEIGGDMLFAWTRSAESVRGDVLAFVGTVGWRFGWDDAIW